MYLFMPYRVLFIDTDIYPKAHRDVILVSIPMFWGTSYQMVQLKMPMFVRHLGIQNGRLSYLIFKGKYIFAT